MDTNQSIRTRIIALFKENLPQRQISARLLVPRSTVKDIIKKFKATNSIQSTRKGRCGRKSQLTMRDQRSLLRCSAEDPNRTARQLQAYVDGNCAKVTTRTVRSYLQRLGQQSCTTKKVPFLDAHSEASSTELVHWEAQLELQWMVENRFFWRIVHRVGTDAAPMRQKTTLATNSAKTLHWTSRLQQKDLGLGLYYPWRPGLSSCSEGDDGFSAIYQNNWWSYFAFQTSFCCLSTGQCPLPQITYCDTIFNWKWYSNDSLAVTKSRSQSDWEHLAHSQAERVSGGL